MTEDQGRLDGLCYDKVVYDYMSRIQKDERGATMNIAQAEDETGLGADAIRRAVFAIRSKGYPVIANSTRRTVENDFRIAESEKEYMEWRNKMVNDIKALIETLKLCDAGAKTKFGTVPIQEVMF